MSVWAEQAPGPPGPVLLSQMNPFKTSWTELNVTGRDWRRDLKLGSGATLTIPLKCRIQVSLQRQHLEQLSDGQTHKHLI